MRTADYFVRFHDHDFSFIYFHFWQSLKNTIKYTLKCVSDVGASSDDDMYSIWNMVFFVLITFLYPSND